jgi:hypothetical protein
MSLEVIGAGLGRTGTISLKVALEELGFGPCYHMSEVFLSIQSTWSGGRRLPARAAVAREEFFTTVVRNGKTLRLRLHATVGEELEIEMALV